MVSSFESAPARDRVIVALDCGIEEAFDLADQLQGKATWMKVGMTLFYANGPAIVYALKERGFKVFLDLKFHDIPHQVEGAAYAAAGSGADMLTMHTVGGIDMMAAAQRGAVRAAAEYGHDVPATLGITVLTSMNDAALAETGVSRAMADQVVVLAEQAKRAGISGVVASPQEAARLRDILGPDAYIVTPGVRPAGSDRGDQAAWPRLPRRSPTVRRTSSSASHHAGGRSGSCIRVHRGRAVGAPSNLRAVWEMTVGRRMVDKGANCF
ncbi:MAG: orotidine-5'-phosphate decarboxylase [Eggerthellaceae bacterium]